MRRMKCAIGAASLLIASTQLASAAVLSGSATVITNPFASGAISTGDADFAVTGPATNLLDGVGGTNARWTNNTGTASSTAFLNSLRGSAASVSAIISQPSFENSGSGPVPFNVRLDGTIRLSSSIDPPTTYALSTFASPISASLFRFEATGIDNGTLGQMGEVFVFPTPTPPPFFGLGTFSRVIPTTATASSTNGGFVATDALDLDGGTPWISDNTDTDRWLEFTFASPTRLSDLFFDNQRGQITDLQLPDGLGGWTTFAQVDGATQYLSLNNLPVTSGFRFFWSLAANGGDFTADTRVSVTAFFSQELIAIPEPAGMGLLLTLASLAVGRRQRRRLAV